MPSPWPPSPRAFILANRAAAAPGLISLTLYFLGKGSYSLPMKSVISSKGQITVPVEIRAKLGLKAGTVVTFEMTKDGALLRKGRAGPHPVDQVFGVLKSK